VAVTFVVEQVFRVSSRESPIFVGRLERPALGPGSRLMTPHGEIVTVLGIDLACGRNPRDRRASGVGILFTEDPGDKVRPGTTLYPYPSEGGYRLVGS
jgi:hypothetical protein